MRNDHMTDGGDSGSPEGQAESELRAVEAQLGDQSEPGAGGEEKPRMPTVDFVRPAVELIANTLAGKKVEKADIDVCAQAYADVLDYYFPEGIGHPVIAALLVTGVMYGKYRTVEPEQSPGATPAHASA